MLGDKNLKGMVQYLTNILANQGLQPLVHSISLGGVTSETNCWEFGIDQTWVDLGDTDGGIDKFKQ